MVKNKKGKKKNKMAGRSRPEQVAESGDTKVPTVLSDNSETEDRTDQTSASRNLILDPEALTSDSGFDSGRGSPGDEPVPAMTTRVEGIGGKLQSPGRKSPGETKAESAAEVNPQNTNKTPEKVAKRVPSCENAAETVSVKGDDDEQKKSDETPRTKKDDQANEHAKKPDSNREKNGGNPPSSIKSKGAVSLRRPKSLEQVKHPLEFPWTFWLFTKDVPWEMALRSLDSFDTAEDFWRLFNRLGNPRVMDQPILMFKKHVKPEWEDPRNQHGGRWSLVQAVQGRQAEKVWQELALMMIGGIQFGDLTPHLNGIYSGWKTQGIYFSVWLDTTEESIARPIGNIIHRELHTHVKSSFHMEFFSFHPKSRKRPMITIR